MNGRRSLVASLGQVRYNPGMNWNLEGHTWAVNLLRRHLSTGQARHAYMLCGPDGVGRRSLALRFAQGLNCPRCSPEGDACMECQACRQTERMQLPDLHVVKVEGENKEIKIDQVRALQHQLSLSPYASPYRVALLLDFQKTSLNAQNAMLKTLEEAPRYSVLILTTDTPESLLPTIASRCEVLRLRPMRLEDAALALQARTHLAPDAARYLAHLSGGRLGYAIHLHENPAELEKRQAQIGHLQELLPASRRVRFAFAEKLTKDYRTSREKVRSELQVWLTYWRDVFLRTTGAAVPLINLAEAAQIDAVADRMDPASARRVVAALERGLDQLDRNVNPRLLMDVLLLDWPRISV